MAKQSKIGKALGFSMDFGEGTNPGPEDDKRQKDGYSEGEMAHGAGASLGKQSYGSKLPKIDDSPAMMDSDDDAGEDPHDGPSSDPSPDSGSMGSEDKGPVAPEHIAMKMFSRAKSPHEQASALKAFGEAMGWGGQSDY